MNIYYISNSVIPSNTANSVHVMKMCQGFSRSNKNVTLYAIKGSEDEEGIYKKYGVENKFKLKRINKPQMKLIGNFLYSMDVKSEVKKNHRDSDIIYGRSIYGIFLLRNQGQFIFESHRLPVRRIHNLMTKMILKNKNLVRVIVISESLKEDYLKHFPFLSEKDVLVAHDGADINNDLKSNDFSEKTKLNIGYIGSLGNFNGGRGIDLIIELANRFPDYTFNLIGGKEEDVEYWKEKTLNVGNICFHGYKPNGDLENYYNEFDILLAPFQRKVLGDGKNDTSKWMSPMKLFDYMSQKKAIICSDLPVLREVLQDRHNCLLCSPEDINDWEKAIKELAGNEELRNKIADNAFNDLKDKYTWKIRAENVLEDLKRL